MLPFDGSTVHSATSAALEELGSLYALGALPPPERDAYVDHLRQCSFCRGQVSQFCGVTALLLEALDEPAASPALRGRILAQVRAELAAEAKPAPEKSRGWITWQWPGWLAPIPAAAIGLLVLAVVGLAAWNFNLSTKLKNQEIALAEQRQLRGAVAAGGSVSTLAGTEAAPGASATLVQDPAGGRSFLLLRSLPPLPADLEYQIWRIKGAQPVGVGTFLPAGGAEQMVVLGADFAGADAIGVSIEPRGGSPAPTGPIVLLGTF